MRARQSPKLCAAVGSKLNPCQGGTDAWPVFPWGQSSKSGLEVGLSEHGCACWLLKSSLGGLDSRNLGPKLCSETHLSITKRKPYLKSVGRLLRGDTHTYTCTHTHMHIHTYVHAHAHTHAHTQMYIHWTMEKDRNSFYFVKPLDIEGVCYSIGPALTKTTPL